MQLLKSSTLLKIKNENKSTSVNFNSFIPFDKTHLLIFSWSFSTNLCKIMHSNFIWVNLLKSKALQAKFQFDFIEHTTLFVRLTLLPTTTRATRESKPPSTSTSTIHSSRTEAQCANRFATKTYLCWKQREICRKTI